jgi:hypothetical protein
VGRHAAEGLIVGPSPSALQGAANAHATMAAQFGWLPAPPVRGWRYASYLKPQPSAAPGGSSPARASPYRRTPRTSNALFCLVRAIAVQDDVLLTVGDAVVGADEFVAPIRAATRTKRSPCMPFQNPRSWRCWKFAA